MVNKIQFDWQYLGYTILPHMRNHSEVPLWRTPWPSHSRRGRTTHCLCLPELKWWESKNKVNFQSYKNFIERETKRKTDRQTEMETNQQGIGRKSMRVRQCCFSSGEILITCGVVSISTHRQLCVLVCLLQVILL